MAARYFIPTSGEYAWTGSVWAATATGAAGSAVTPVDGDDVYILNGTARITSALDQSAIQLNSLNIGFNGEIGTSGASLQIGLDTSDHAHINGGATLRLSIVQTSGSNLYIYDDFSGIVFLNSCTLANVFAGRGGQCVANGGTITQILTAGCAVNIQSGTTVTSMAALGSGNHVVSAPIGGIQMYGSANVTASGPTAAHGADVACLGVGWYTHDSAGTITQLDMYPLSKARTTGAYGGFTITDSYIWVGAKVFESPPVQITYTNAPIKYGFR